MIPDYQAAYERALKRIEACRRKQDTWLDLSRLGLTRLPPEIGQLTKLTRLFLHGNAVLAIPDSILGPTFIDTITARKTVARPQDILNFHFTHGQGRRRGHCGP